MFSLRSLLTPAVLGKTIPLRLAVARAAASASSASGSSSSSSNSSKAPKDDVSVEALGPAISRVSAKVDRALLEVQEQGARHYLWTHGLEAAKAIAASPQRHMLGPRLVLLGALHNKQSKGPAHPKHHGGKSHSQGAAGVPENEAVETFAASVELLHLFMLIQDDIMDHATVRRGAQTVHMSLLRSRGHVVDGNKAGHGATLIADVIHAKAAQLMASSAAAAGNVQAFNTIMDASYHAAIAQFEDLIGWRAYEEVLNVSPVPEETMRQTLLDKCATHKFSAPLQAGMQLAGAPKNLQEAAHAWGQHFGLAFQALDDLSDLISEASETGKDSMQDFREGRLSILLYLMRKHASRDEWNEALGIFKCMGIVTPPDRRFLFDIMDKYKLPQHCLSFAREEITKAEAAIKSHKEHEMFHRGITEFIHGLQHHAAKLEERCKGLKK